MNQATATPPPLSSFVTVMACLSIALGVLGVVSGLMQGAVLMSMDPGELMRQQFAAIGATLPPQLLWMFDHLGLLNFLSLLSSAFVTVISWGLLKRHEWGRLGFIACLLLGAVAGFFFAAWFVQAMTWMNAQISADLAETDPMVKGMQSAMKTIMIVSAVLIAAAHGGIVWKLCTPAIRAEFRR